MKIINPSNELYFLPLGGSGEIGMNLNLYRYQGRWLMVDLGVTFSNDLGIEIIMPDTKYIEAHLDKLEGLVLTHGHEDHIGAIPYLWQRLKCPIYATPFTAALVRGKLKEAGLIDGVKLIEIPLGGKVQLGSFEVEFVTLTHSIPEPNALAIRTPAGVVIHTGDWKIDENPLVGKQTDKKRLKEIGDEGVLALMCDSTNVFVEGHTESEAKVRESLIELIGRQKNRVAVGLFASNVARLETCAMAAQAHGRQAALIGRSLIRMYEAACEVGYLKNIPKFLSEGEAMNMPRDKVLMLCTGSQGEQRAALSRIAQGSHPRVSFDSGDTVIFSSRQIPGNELSISELKQKLKMNGVQVISDGEEFTHVSGHPAREELLEMYKLVRPQVLVPVHGEYAHMHEQVELGLKAGIPQAIVPFNGSLIRLCPGKPEVIEEVANGRLCLDGKRVVPLISNHLRERQFMMRDGIAVVSLLIGRSNEIAEPTLSFVGLTLNQDEETRLRQAVLLELAALIKEAEPEMWFIDDKIKALCKTAVRRAVRAVSGHKPFVVTHIMRVDADV